MKNKKNDNKCVLPFFAKGHRPFHCVFFSIYMAKVFFAINYAQNSVKHLV